MSSPASPAPKRSKGKIAAIAGGGCCGALVLVVLVIAIVGAIVGPTEPSASAPATTVVPAEETSSAPIEETTAAKETEPATEESADPSEEPAEKTTTPEQTTAAEEDPGAWAAEVESSALMGSSDWQELCGGDYSLGICWISDVTSTSVGTLDVTLQLNGKDEESEYYAEGVANTFFTTAAYEHEDLEWVVVYDASGVVIDQKKRSDYPLLAG